MPHYFRSQLREAQDAALGRGDHTFTTSEPCANGHLAARYASNGVCVMCASEYRRNAKPREQRLLKIASSQCQVKQVSQDDITIKLTKNANRRFAEITGRPASLSIIHKAGLVLLANYLSQERSVGEVMGLVK